ncbi:MAG: asparagine--tRNA ligase [Bacteroidetes bacterium RIFCSPLOWO2_02_FULL_36_8]|nr:MAG: asparagine--tRNA ligase [Bacteroidetes bacterium RIFCSPLOWO2_02_FULL_36_8]OFY69493.1 MAG: asparagine--tRNA ligase [Bacteroidetes bacterium RIFCSPLOWO2_12_FULL_37_12]
MPHSKIKSLLSTSPVSQEVTSKGWVRSNRTGKNVSFIALNDGSCLANLQIVADAQKFPKELLMSAQTGACISVTGKLVASTGSGQPVEIQADSIEILGASDPAVYPLQKKGHSLEFLREIAHLRFRTNTFGAVFRIRHSLAYAIHEFFHKRGFYYLHTPIITGSDCEGAGAMFRVTAMDLKNPLKTPNGDIDFAKDFFGKETYLTVSGQLEGELGALALSEIYTFGPTFRAENSNTTRHLSEFWMIEPEMAFYDLKDNMRLAEDFLKYLIQFVLDNNKEDLEFLNKMYDSTLIEKLRFVTQNNFRHLTYTEGMDIIQKSGKKFELQIQWGSDLQSEHERFLVEEHFKTPVILTDYPKDIKAFYMKQNEDGKTVRAMDILFPGIGEIIGGSQREENYEKLVNRIREMKIDEKNLGWYLDTRRFGTCVHSGFGLGFERLVLFATGMSNIRDVIPFPRAPKEAAF